MEQLSYVQKNQEAVICRCYGEDGYLELPAMIDGLPVTALADHCFAPEETVRIPRKTWITACQGADGEFHTGQAQDLPVPVSAEAVREIVLPETLKTIGNYAFCNCRNLRQMTFPAGLWQLGGGAFVGCNHLEKLIFRTAPLPQKNESAAAFLPENPPCMKEALSDISYEIQADLVSPGGELLCSLLFPDYIEESEENTPARIITVKYEGTGFRYRQCFQERRLDFARYDALFSSARAIELPSTVMKMALLRLQTPAGLSEESREAYLSFLRGHTGELLKTIFAGHQGQFLEMLCREAFFDREMLSSFIEAASAAGAAEEIALLMDYRKKHFPARRRQFVLPDE